MNPNNFERELSTVKSLLQEAYSEAGGPGDVDMNAPILSLGIDSIGLVGLNGDLKATFGRGISIEQVVNGATGNDVAEFLRREIIAADNEPA